MNEIFLTVGQHALHVARGGVETLLLCFHLGFGANTEGWLPLSFRILAGIVMDKASMASKLFSIVE